MAKVEGTITRTKWRQSCAGGRDDAKCGYANMRRSRLCEALKLNVDVVAEGTRVLHLTVRKCMPAKKQRKCLQRLQLNKVKVLRCANGFFCCVDRTRHVASPCGYNPQLSLLTNEP